MARLGRVITEAIVHEYGRDEFLRRLAHPFWFQSFGAVMGMDWHSSGITTSVMGALKRGLAPLERGARHPRVRRPRPAFAPHARRARRRRRTQRAWTARRWRARAGSPRRSTAPPCRTASRSTCTASSSADDGSWVVVQQGMNADAPAGAALPLAVGERDELRRRAARRDRRRRARARSSTSPIAARAGARAPRSALAQGGPDAVVPVLRRLRDAAPALPAPHLHLPAHHDVRADRRRPAPAARRRWRRPPIAAPHDFAELLLVPGVGARTVAASRWSPRSCTARPAASPTRRASRSRTAARTATRFPVPLASTTRPSPCSAARSSAAQAGQRREAGRDPPPRRSRPRDRSRRRGPAARGAD